MINKKDVLEILATTMLVYDYGKRFTLEDDQNIENFTNSIGEDVLNSLSKDRREVLMNISKYAPNGKVVDFIDDERTDLQVGITKSDNRKRIIIVFRGTESRRDWFYDFSIFKKNIAELVNPLSNDIRIHSGFHRQLFDYGNYEKIVRCVKSLLEKDEYKDYEIYTTGHSLGGGLCTVFGYFLSREIDNMVNIISFASPRVGNAGFRRDFTNRKNITHYRITNNRDIVTATPMVGYKHTGLNIHLTPTTCALCEASEYNPYWKFSLFRCWSVSDHNIDLYYRRLKENSWPRYEKQDIVNEEVPSLQTPPPQGDKDVEEIEIIDQEAEPVQDQEPEQTQEEEKNVIHRDDDSKLSENAVIVDI